MTGGRLDGSRTLVTGAASGIGLATAARFAAEGAAVGLLDRDADRLHAVVRGVTAGGWVSRRSWGVACEAAAPSTRSLCSRAKSRARR